MLLTDLRERPRHMFCQWVLTDHEGLTQGRVFTVVQVATQAGLLREFSSIGLDPMGIRPGQHAVTARWSSKQIGAGHVGPGGQWNNSHLLSHREGVTRRWPWVADACMSQLRNWEQMDNWKLYQG